MEKNKKILLLINAAVIMFEIIGLVYSIDTHGIALLCFYTQDSNILAPMGGGFINMFFHGSKLYHHLLCPILIFVSYCFLEEHPVIMRRDAYLIGWGIQRLFSSIL